MRLVVGHVTPPGGQDGVGTAWPGHTATNEQGRVVVDVWWLTKAVTWLVLGERGLVGWGSHHHRLLSMSHHHCYPKETWETTCCTSLSTWHRRALLLLACMVALCALTELHRTLLALQCVAAVAAVC